MVPGGHRRIAPDPKLHLPPHHGCTPDQGQLGSVPQATLPVPGQLPFAHLQLGRSQSGLFEPGLGQSDGGVGCRGACAAVGRPLVVQSDPRESWCGGQRVVPLLSLHGDPWAVVRLWQRDGGRR